MAATNAKLAREKLASGAAGSVERAENGSAPGCLEAPSFSDTLSLAEPDSNCREAALDLLSRGLSVISTHRDKTPDGPWAEFQTRFMTEDEVVRRFDPASNIAIVTGRFSQVLAIDIDSRPALVWARDHLPRTPWQTRTPRGFHLFYRHPGGDVRNRAHIGRLALDLRADGGYVLAAPSLHASGERYVQAGDWTASRDELPVFSPDWLKRLDTSQRLPLVAVMSGDIEDRARRYLRATPVPVLGHGSDALTFMAACKLARGFDLEPEAAVQLLAEWAPANFDGWWIHKKVKHALQYGQEQIGGLR